MKKTFRATVSTTPDDNLFIEIPFDVKSTFGKARPPVIVTLGKHTYRSTISVYAGKSLLGVRKSHREAAALTAGAKVTVTLEADNAPRVIDPPPDLEKALAKNNTARAAWNKLSYTHQREHAEALLDAKKPETRLRRLTKTLAMLTST
jgi:hypothetical protein